MVLFTEKVDFSALERLLMRDGILQPVDYAALKQFSQNQITQFCVHHAIYQIVTNELLEFLRQNIGSQKAIEIGSGNGCLARCLGIPATDSKIQETEEIKQIYAMMKQPVITYGLDVIKMDATEAINAYAPDVVIGAWVTQRWKPGMKDGLEGGVDEASFKGKIKKYIVVGNDNVHGRKEIFNIFPSTTYRFDWLVSRSWKKEDNGIYIFHC